MKTFIIETENERFPMELEGNDLQDVMATLKRDGHIIGRKRFVTSEGAAEVNRAVVYREHIVAITEVD